MFRRKLEIPLEATHDCARHILVSLGEPVDTSIDVALGDVVVAVGERAAGKLRLNGRPLTKGRCVLLEGDVLRHSGRRVGLTSLAKRGVPAPNTRTMARAILGSAPVACSPFGPCLVVIEGEAAGRRWPLSEGEQTIGRSVDCEIVLNEPSVSREHAKLRRRSELVEVRDGGSRHGLRVGGRRVRGWRRIHEGDELVLGTVRLRYLSSRRMQSLAAAQLPPRSGGEAGLPAELTALPDSSIEAARPKVSRRARSDLLIATLALGLLLIGGAVSTLAFAPY